MSNPKVVAVVGPTASGKTSLAIKIAQQFNGEVISCDSRQVYKGLDIGTAKVTKEEMMGVPHHLLDVTSPKDTYTAEDFKQDATVAINEIQNRNNLPIVAGGTFFYLDQLRGKGVGPKVPVNDELRTKLEPLTAEVLHRKLLAQDPERASTIDPQNKRRLVRALEIVDALGKVPKPKTDESPYEWLIIGLSVPKETLIVRYEARVEHWLDSGIIEETEWLQDQVPPERFKEFGFEYVVTEEFIAGAITEDELRKKYVERNWQYAKRQLTWLKRDDDIKWFNLHQESEISDLVSNFLQ